MHTVLGDMREYFITRIYRGSGHRRRSPRAAGPYSFISALMPLESATLPWPLYCSWFRSISLSL